MRTSGADHRPPRQVRGGSRIGARCVHRRGAVYIVGDTMLAPCQYESTPLDRTATIPVKTPPVSASADWQSVGSVGSQAVLPEAPTAGTGTARRPVRQSVEASVHTWSGPAFHFLQRRSALCGGGNYARSASTKSRQFGPGVSIRRLTSPMLGTRRTTATTTA